MKINCEKCHGDGEIECEHCGHSYECGVCDGTGYQFECISEYEIPEKHDRGEELADIKSDAIKCIADHEKLLNLNPRAKESYDAQLKETLEKLNSKAESLDDN